MRKQSPTLYLDRLISHYEKANEKVSKYAVICDLKTLRKRVNLHRVVSKSVKGYTGKSPRKKRVGKPKRALRNAIQA